MSDLKLKLEASHVALTNSVALTWIRVSSPSMPKDCMFPIAQQTEVHLLALARQTTL